ncbi:MAG: hypothetical protein ACI4IL_07575, partial [Eubacterium sp.]
ERLTVNQDVTGSSPVGGAISFKSELFTGFGFFRVLSGEGCVWVNRGYIENIGGFRSVYITN